MAGSVPTFTTVMNYEGSNFGVQASEQELQRMATGDTNLIEEVLNRPTTRLVLLPDGSSVTSDPDCHIHEYGEPKGTDHTVCLGSSKEAWNRTSTRIFLSLVSENYAELRNPKTKKKELWDRLALSLKEKGFAFHGSELQKKWSNTLETYRKNKDKESRYGEASVRWEWFEMMEEFVDCEPRMTPANVSFGSTLQNDDSPSSDDHESNSGFDLPRSKKRRMRSDMNPSKAAKMEKGEKAAKNPLAVEMKRARELKQHMFEEVTKMEREKLKEERERWKEEKALRVASDQKKIDAVLMIAKAIQQLASAILKSSS